MNCDTEMAANSNNKVPLPQDPEPISDVLATTATSLEAKSGVGEVTSSLKATDHPSHGDGDQGEHSSTTCSNNSSSNADDRSDLEAISDTLPSQVSPASFGGCFGPSIDMILSSHRRNTAANLGDGLQHQHARNLSSTSSNAPWGADSPWGTYKIPEAFDEQGRMTAWEEVIVQKVKPYVPAGQPGQNGGSGLLDSEDPTHHYLMMPIESLADTPEVPEYIQEQRRMYSEAAPIIRGPDDHTGVTDDEDSDDGGDDNNHEVRNDDNSHEVSSDDKNNEVSGDDDDHEVSSDDNNHQEEVEIIPANIANIPNTAIAYAAVAASPEPSTLTFGGLWTAMGREVRESRISQEADNIEVIFVPGCTEETGSVMSSLTSYYDDEPVIVDEQDPVVPPIPEEKPVSDVQDMQAHNVLHRILVTTTDGGTVRIDLPRAIFVSRPGKPTKELAFSIANLGKTCWDIIKDHGIGSVTTIDAKKRTDIDTSASFLPAINRVPYVEPTNLLPVFDSAWIQKNAKLAMKDDFPDYEYYGAIQAPCDQHLEALSPQQISFFYNNFGHFVTHYLLNKPLAPIATLEEELANGAIVAVDESNLTVPQFIKRLFIEPELARQQHRLLHETYHPDRPFVDDILPTQDAAAMVDDWPVQERVLVPKTFNHERGTFDLQQLDWIGNTGFTPEAVRHERDARYVEYRNTDTLLTHGDPTLEETANLAHFVPKAMYTKHKASGPHKQLRNLVASKSYNSVVYASDRGEDRSKVFHYYPFHGMRDCIIDLSTTNNETPYTEPVRITTVALSTGDFYRGICMVGGFEGEYALKNMLHEAEEEDRAVVVGHATKAKYGIVNHIDIDYFAFEKYLAAMACNDNKVRILDVETDTFLSDPGSNTNTAAKSGQLSGHQYPFAVNCTSMCPDGKMRALVGDTTDVVIVNAESGRSERVLQGHDDYGFAVAWSPDGRYVASASQDRLVKIWDARTWRTVTELSAEVAGYRSMRWSPVGGGSKCLLLAEPADRICLVNATTFDKMQTHDFYGEIAGVDFQGDGSGLWVANADEKFGGMMEYERRGWGQKFGKGFLAKKATEEAGGVFREQGPNEWCWEDDRLDDPRVVDKLRSGAAGNYTFMGL